MIGQYLLLLILLCTLFSFRGLRPANAHYSRNFSEQEFRSPDTCRGLYPPIPFGSTEIDLNAAFEPPLYRKPAEDWTEANDGFIHFLGTDNTGRDVLTLMLYGTRISMTVGFVAVGIYVTVGIILVRWPAISVAGSTC